MLNKLVDELIEIAILEDIGDGDHTSLSCIPENAEGRAQLLVKQQSIIAGVEIAEIVFRKINESLLFEKIIEDGTKVGENDIVFSVSGNLHAILQAERLVLNIMQRMSGVATQTHRYVEKLKDLKTTILDTRKTTPGMRLLDKMAVKLGGGQNHRIGLYDMILIKDNHIDFAGGIEQAIRRTHEYLDNLGKSLLIEVETRSLDDLSKVMSIGDIDVIMLDNFSTEDTKKAVKMIDGRFKTESSGGITFENIREYALCGVDYISVGALTHQIQSIDLSLKAIDF